MTVQELIDALNKVEDKSLPVYHFTGFDIHNWIDQNVDWMNDFSPQMRDAVTKNELQNYLIW